MTHFHIHLNTGATPDLEAVTDSYGAARRIMAALRASWYRETSIRECRDAGCKWSKEEDAKT